MNRRWQKRREQASHADDWLMTYADMITLLLCFFAIFLSVSIPKKDVPPIRPPDVIEGNLPLHGLPHSDERSTDGTVDVPVEAAAKVALSPPETAVRADVPTIQPVDVPPEPAVKPVAPPPETPNHPDTSAVHPAENVAVETPVVPAVKPSLSLPEIVDRLKTGGPADIQQKGDRITTLQMNSAAFFGSGSAALSNSGKSILQDVAVNLKSEKFKDYQVTVEGHTDDQPISTAQFPSNWELSTARAAAVVKFFLEQGISAQKLRAAGYADTFPIAPNRDASGKPIPENQARNRRVVINLEKIVRAE